MFGKNHNLTLFYLSYLEKKHKIKGTHEFNLHFMTHYSRLTSDKIFPSKAISGNLVSSTMLPQKKWVFTSEGHNSAFPQENKS